MRGDSIPTWEIKSGPVPGKKWMGAEITPMNSVVTDWVPMTDSACYMDVDYIPIRQRSVTNNIRFIGSRLPETCLSTTEIGPLIAFILLATPNGQPDRAQCGNYDHPASRMSGQTHRSGQI
jgi:hypothetical protein